MVAGCSRCRWGPEGCRWRRGVQRLVEVVEKSCDLLELTLEFSTQDPQQDGITGFYRTLSCDSPELSPLFLWLRCGDVGTWKVSANEMYDLSFGQRGIFMVVRPEYMRSESPEVLSEEESEQRTPETSHPEQ